jgi:DNA-binding CsgD family transcriptional regulator
MHDFEWTHLASGKSATVSRDRDSTTRSHVENRQPTPRELQVEDLLCRGYSQENIAAIFGRSISTISIHTASLYRKRGVHTQVELLLAYLKRKGIFVFGAGSES